jgi:secreted PhoX family phosphatase
MGENHPNLSGPEMIDPTRRRLLLSTLAVGAAAALPWQGLLAAVQRPKLVVQRDRATGLWLLALPPGFDYLSFGWTDDPLDDGTPTPPRHDGMGVVRARGARLTLVRNHEVSSDDGAFATGEVCYDPAVSGGCTTLEFDARAGALLGARVSLAGTVWNCAGGPTPWGTWLSGEEIVLGPNDPHPREPRLVRHTRDHGFVFEVHPDGGPARPLPALGRFHHEAAAVDPASGRVYLTEDRPSGGLYRFTPTAPGDLERGGVLEMMAVEGAPELRRGVRRDHAYPVRWVRIDDPLRAHAPGTRDTLGVFGQGAAQGGTAFARGEGCVFHDRVLHFSATSGGDAGRGQVWRYDPRSETLRLVFESPGDAVLSGPDNITVTPRGGLLVCEDGAGPEQRLIAIGRDGRAVEFARNAIRLDGERNRFRGDYRDREFAGACFSPDGRWLFVNVQTPGITFAITGPWSKLGL